MSKILHFSPVRKSKAILALHLNGLGNLDHNNHIITFSFFDDNTDPGSSELLEEFVSNSPKAILHQFDMTRVPDYNGKKRWAPHLYERITYIKNEAIRYFLSSDYDYLFLCDSDLIVHPETVNQLVLEGRDFCSSIFWTKFEKSPLYTPNAWFSKPKGFEKNDLLSFRDQKSIKVDYTGACTLLTRKILEDGVSFEKIPNIPYLGEDKHFCIRAAVLGYPAFVTTHYPVFHVYNNEYIENGKKYIKSGFNPAYLNDWLNEDWEVQVDKWLLPQKKSFIKKLRSKIGI